MKSNKGQFKKGQTPWNKGIPQSKKMKEKLREANFSKKNSLKTRIKKSIAKMGNTYGFKKGEKGYWTGKKRTQETKDKIREKQIGKFAGDKNIFWIDGRSFEPYGIEFNEDLKEVVRNRDRRKCFGCEKTELENGRKLSIHHIDRNKKNNNLNNLISLCDSCHAKTHHKDFIKLCQQ